MSNVLRCPNCQENTLRALEGEWLVCKRCNHRMSYFSRYPYHSPVRRPDLGVVHKSEDGRLRRPYILVWFTTQDEPKAVSSHHLYRTAVKRAREMMTRDDSSVEMNRHTRFYVWDSSLGWNPSHAAIWIPIAENAIDQYVLSR